MSATITSNSQAPEPIKPWYRHGWLWFLISFPLVSVALGSVMLYLAFSANNSLVVDDYYREGKAYNLRIERDRLASLLVLNAVVTQSTEGLVLDLEQQALAVLPQSLQNQAQDAKARFAWPQSLTIRWVHVTQEPRDGSTTMQFIGGGRYVAPGISLPQQGKFRLHIAPADTGIDFNTAPLTLESDLSDANNVGDNWRLISKLVGFASQTSFSIAAPLPEQVFTRTQLN